ncbi:MAG: clostripain-related cysteine peptidase [Sphaerochaetaceae bacterium]
MNIRRFDFFYAALLSVAIICSLSCTLQMPLRQSEREWVFMIYMDADNNLENASIEDFHEMSYGLYQKWLDDYQIDRKFAIVVQYDDYFRKQQGRYEIQKSSFFDESSTLTGKIEGTGNEVDMGSAQTLKDFINFCKEEYPSEHYALFLWNHGGGVRSSSDEIFDRAICWDESTEDGDPLYTGEISDVLTEDESVDLIAMDACLMGMAEIAYQYRPKEGAFGSQIITFSPATEAGDGYEYDHLISSLGDLETLTAEELGKKIVRSYEASYEDRQGETQTAVDLTKMENLKAAWDALASELTGLKDDIGENVRGSGEEVYALHYFQEGYAYQWNDYAIFDLYDVVLSIRDRDYSAVVNERCDDLLDSVDDAVITSFYGGDEDDFEDGKNGLGFFFPDGDTTWSDQYFYTSLDNDQFILWADENRSSWDGYGNIEMCDGDDDHVVESWFELLQYWYNPTRDETVHPGPMW